MKKLLVMLAASVLLCSGCSSNDNEESTRKVKKQTTTKEVTTAAPATKPHALETITIEGKKLGKYGRFISTNKGSKYEEAHFIYKLPAGEYKAQAADGTTKVSFSVINDCIIYDNTEKDLPERVHIVDYLTLKNGEFGEFSLKPDESIEMECDENINFYLLSESTDTSYYLIGGETGEHGRVVTLGANTDFPVRKYCYKIPAGTYTAVTSFEKLADFWLVKDETQLNEDGVEELVYGEHFNLTAGDDDFGGSAKKQVEFTIAEDESILITVTKGIEFIVTPK